MNIRHDIPLQLIRDSVTKKIALATAICSERKNELRELLAGKVTRAQLHDRLALVDNLRDKKIQQENEYYSTVRVLEIPDRSQMGCRFFLVYGPVEDSIAVTGTGPFVNYTEAEEWFIGGGR